MSYQVKAGDFEGPLDLLLHLIRKNELDIYTISVGDIADQYLAYVEMIQSLNLDRVGDFLLMAATLAYHKSRMLLPESARKEDEEDDEGYQSLEELQRRLIEYQRYKEAALELQSHDLLDRDVFRVSVQAGVSAAEVPPPVLKASLFDLLDAFQQMLKTAPQETVHEVIPERIKLVDRIVEVMEQLIRRGSMSLEEFFEGPPTKQILIVTFLSVLELMRLQFIHAYQTTPFGPIQLRLVSGEPDHQKLLKEKLTTDEL